MNPDQIQDLANNIADLRAAVNQLAGASSLMANSFQRTVTGLSQVDPAFRNAANSLRDSVENTRQAGNAVQQEQIAAAAMMKRNAAEQQYATQQLVSSLRSLSSGLTSLNPAISNLSGGFGVLGSSVQKAAMGFGLSADAAEALKKAISGVGNDVLRQADAYLGLKNSLIKLGGAGEHTASSLYAYAKAAGLHMDSLNYMLAPLRSVGSNILALGRGAGDAQKAFMEMLQVTDEQRDRFARLGIMQEDLMQRQGDFVTQASSAGLSFRLMSTDIASLRKASTEYVRNLYDLAALTGESVDEQAKKQRAVVEERRLMMENLALQAKAARLRKEADEAEALGTPEGRQEAEDKRRQAAIAEKTAEDQTRLIAALAKLPEETRTGIIQAMTTGGALGSDGAAMLARRGVLDDILKIVSEQKAARERGEKTDPERDAMRIKQIIADAGLANAEALKGAMQLGSEDLLKQFGYDVPGIQFIKDYAGRDLAGELDKQRQQARAAEEPGVDRVSDIVASLQNASIALNKMYNDFIAGFSPFIQAFNLVTNELSKTASLLGVLGDAANEVTNAFLRLPNMAKDKLETAQSKFQDVPLQGGSSTIGQRPPAPEISTLPPPPAVATTTPETVPATTPAATAAPATTPEAPVVTPGTTAPSTTPIPVVTGGTPETPAAAPSVPAVDQNVTPQITPVPNYPAITVDTNLGNKITLPSAGVAKIANLIKEGKNREQLRQELLKYIGRNSGYNNVTLDKIIDKSAEVANLQKPAGSTVPTTAVTTAPATTPATTPEVVAPAAQPSVSAPAAPEAAPVTAPATTPAPATETAKPTAPESQPVATATTVKPETEADKTKLPADIPTQAYVPSAELKAWIRSQIRRGVRRDKVREALIRQGYTAQQADIALTAELGNIPGTPAASQTPATTAKPETRPQGTGPTATTPAATGQGRTPPQSPRVPAVTATPNKPGTPVDYDLSTPDFDTVSPEQRNWLNRENELRDRLSDMVRNKKSITKDQANQILDYYDTIKDKGSIPTVDQIIQNSGALTKPAATGTSPTSLTGSRPEVVPSTQGRVRQPRQVTPPSEIANKAGYLPTESGNINTNLEELMAAGLDPSMIRGNKIQEPVDGDTDPDTFDTHAEGAQIDPKLFEAVTQLVAMSNSGVTPFKISNITSLNDNFHNVQKLDSQHRKGRAVDFKLQLPPGQEKPTDKQFQELSSFLKSNLGFDEVTNEYTKKSAGWTGPHIHAHFNDPQSTMMGGDNFKMPADVLQAAMGGIASGPKSGFPALLHGNEIIVPLDPNSILADLGKKSQDQIKTEMMTVEKSISGEKFDPAIFRDISRQNQQIMEMIGYKLDNVINKLDMGNDTQSKILKYSQV